MFYNQSMQGFDPKFSDLTDYIIKITEEIWEGRGLDKIRDYYAEDVIIHTPSADITGVETTVQNTADMLEIFPDRCLLPHDVITSETKTADGVDYFSSHRIVSTMHHRGAGKDAVYGEPTGKGVIVFTIADCAARNNQIYHEWLVRDNLAIVKHIGLDPQEFASKMSISEKDLYSYKYFNGGGGNGGANVGVSDAIEKYKLQHLTAEAQQKVLRYLDFFVKLRTGESLEQIAHIYPKAYHRAVGLYLPGCIHDYGHAGAHNFFSSYAAALPDAELGIDEVTVVEDPQKPLRVAVRWLLKARHNGAGRFGEPSGKEITTVAITHSDLDPANGQITNEWNIIDELAILAQTTN